ncbi:MAG: RNA polymerase factor sigma-54 [Dehalococcoidia bacterium]|nr:RNA polymerase factor sigma-54 [Dehalococcoidia bacterium]
MELSQALEQRPTITPQLIIANTLLQLSSTELEQTIAQEIAENPALGLLEVQRCPRCGLAMPDGYCLSCTRLDFQAEKGGAVHREYSADSASFSEYDAADERDDLISQLASNTTLADYLLYQLRPSLSSHDLPIATYLVQNLDDHGFLRCDLDEVASLFGVDRACIENVVSAMQELDPVGIAARDARECLLIQLEHLRREGAEQPLAKAVIQDHWEALGKQSLAQIAKAVGATVGEVRAALQFIKNNLNPFPAHAHWASLHESPPQRTAIYPRPDIMIRNSPASSGGGYEIELPGAQAYRLRLSTSYLKAMEGLKANNSSSTDTDWEQWEAFLARAQLFIKSVEQRWRTLHHLALCLVNYQRDFLAYGERHLRPLTRAQLAAVMGVHESTVSRAVASKYVQLPYGRIIPLARFFDSSTAVKEVIKELIAQENEPLSDREIAEKLAQRGHHIARRTVAKYRNALGILPASLRRRSRTLSTA